MGKLDGELCISLFMNTEAWSAVRGSYGVAQHEGVQFIQQ